MQSRVYNIDMLLTHERNARKVCLPKRRQFKCLLLLIVLVILRQSVVFIFKRYAVTDYPETRCGFGINKAAQILADNNRNPLPKKMKTGRGRFAYTTLAISSVYLPGAKLLACSLKLVNAKFPLVVFVAKTMVPEAKEFFKNDDNIEVRGIRLIHTPNNYQARFGFCYTKLQLFAQEEFSRFIYTDADNTYRKNVDELFTRKLDYGIAMAKISSPDSCEYLSGRAQYSQASANFMVFDTNINIRDDMLRILKARPELRFQDHFSEQMFLQWYFYAYLNWLPTMYTITSDEENIDQAFTIHHSKKPFFRFAKRHLHFLTPEVRKCINMTGIPFVVVDDGSEGVPSDHLPNMKDQKDAINVNHYGNT